MNRAFPRSNPETGTGTPWSASEIEEAGGVPVLPESFPALAVPADPRPWLESHRDDLVIALDWPVIVEAAEAARLGKHRDLVALDQGYPIRRTGPWAEASFRVGRRQLSRLRAARDLRAVQRYLDAVEAGSARAWNPIVFGVALAAFHLPYRQGLLHYGGTLLRGLAERCRPSDLSTHDWNAWIDHLEAPLPEAVNRLLPPAFGTPGDPAGMIDH
jgi:urease accessory protein UreF